MKQIVRQDSRKVSQIRKVRIKKHFLKYAEGSCLIEMGNTHVICSASVDESVPPFLRGKGTGWVTAEYAMLPRSCKERIAREGRRGPSGRSQEIQRLIGRSLRSIVDMKLLGERCIWIDCDVLQGDGGTRTASITGGFVALALAVQKLIKSGTIERSPLKDYLAAISVGIVDGTPMTDLMYTEDSTAEVDMNVVMTGSGKFVEIQGTAEGMPYTKKHLSQLIGLAENSIKELVEMQKKVVKI